MTFCSGHMGSSLPKLQSQPPGHRVWSVIDCGLRWKHGFLPLIEFGGWQSALMLRVNDLEVRWRFLNIVRLSEVFSSRYPSIQPALPIHDTIRWDGDTFILKK